MWLRAAGIDTAAVNPLFHWQETAAREGAMKLQRQLFAIALVLTTSVSGFGRSSSEQKREHLRMLLSEGFRQVSRTPLDRAYVDAVGLLTQAGQCSEFFGGQPAQNVLEELLINLREERINDASIGIRMSGSFTCFVDSAKGVSYRLFTSTELNTAGPFYKSKVFAAEPSVPNIGSFRPNTRAARVLILLHELAHLVRNKDGVWLIPDDGNSPQLSRQNTMTVESRCGQQIRAL
jgi:hypothetical protein